MARYTRQRCWDCRHVIGWVPNVAKHGEWVCGCYCHKTKRPSTKEQPK